MVTIGQALEIGLGVGLLSLANWILLAPLVGAPVPSLGPVGGSVFAFLVGCILVGRGTKRAISSRTERRPEISDQDHTLDWMTRP